MKRDKMSDLLGHALNPLLHRLKKRRVPILITRKHLRQFYHTCGKCIDIFSILGRFLDVGVSDH